VGGLPGHALRTARKPPAFRKELPTYPSRHRDPGLTGSTCCGVSRRSDVPVICSRSKEKSWRKCALSSWARRLCDKTFGSPSLMVESGRCWARVYPNRDSTTAAVVEISPSLMTRTSPRSRRRSADAHDTACSAPWPATRIKFSHQALLSSLGLASTGPRHILKSDVKRLRDKTRRSSNPRYIVTVWAAATS